MWWCLIPLLSEKKEIKKSHKGTTAYTYLLCTIAHLFRRRFTQRKRKLKTITLIEFMHSRSFVCVLKIALRQFFVLNISYSFHETDGDWITYSWNVVLSTRTFSTQNMACTCMKLILRTSIWTKHEADANW